MICPACLDRPVEVPDDADLDAEVIARSRHLMGRARALAAAWRKGGA